jgi:hypothetical protein
MIGDLLQALVILGVGFFGLNRYRAWKRRRYFARRLKVHRVFRQQGDNE